MSIFKRKSLKNIINQDCTLFVSKTYFDKLSLLTDYNNDTNVLKVGKFNVKLIVDPMLSLKKDNVIIVPQNCKLNNNNNIVYSDYIPFVSSNSLIKTEEQLESHSFSKRELVKTNFHDVYVKSNTLSFYLSFLRHTDTKKMLFIDSNGQEKTLNISFRKDPLNSYNFKYFSMIITVDQNEIVNIKIPDSYYGDDDCVAYLHGIYRNNKEDVYKITVDLNTGNLISKFAKRR